MFSVAWCYFDLLSSEGSMYVSSLTNDGNNRHPQQHVTRLLVRRSAFFVARLKTTRYISILTGIHRQFLTLSHVRHDDDGCETTDDSKDKDIIAWFSSLVCGRSTDQLVVAFGVPSMLTTKLTEPLKQRLQLKTTVLHCSRLVKRFHCGTKL